MKEIREMKSRFIKGIGLAIVAFWLIMMSALVFKTTSDQASQPGNSSETRTGISGPAREWMDIFLKADKVGYSLKQIQPLEEGYAIHEEIFLKLNLLGRANIVHTDTYTLVDHNFHLKYFRFRIRSGITTFEITGDVRNKWLIVKQQGGGIEKRIRLREPLYVGSAIDYFFRGKKLKVGQHFRFPFFDPSTMSRNTVVVSVKKKETIKVHGIRYRAYHLETGMLGQQISFWIDEKGSVLKESGLMGMTLVRSNAAAAPRGISGKGGQDFYELAAVKADRRIPRPRQLRFLKIKMEGIEKTPFHTILLNGSRQQFDKGVLEITVENPPSRRPYVLPLSKPSAAILPYLRPEMDIESDDPALQKKAHEIVGGEKDPVVAARRILSWVYSNMEQRPVLSVPSAREVLKTMVGDCNEHAVLLTALLRAAGIPAKVCAGLVYANGKFYYHAWTEGYLGRWISMDATLNQMPVDATHIKLVEGDLEKQTAIIGLIGKLRIQVLDYKYD